MIQDLHAHTYYSYCGMDSPEAVVKNAIESGIELMGISDHYYGIVMNKPGFVYESPEHKAKMHNDALRRYYEHIKLLADKYKDHIEIWCGIEVTAADYGYTLLCDGVDVSLFDYCLIENIQTEQSVVSDVFDFSARCNCKRTGLAHIDLPAYIRDKGFGMEEFFAKMAENDIFWELNVNYDSIHKYKEHQYVKDFFADDKIKSAVKNAGMKMSVGFDGHNLADYDAARVKTACKLLEESGIEMVAH